MQECTRCHEVKPIDAFHKHAGMAGGFRTRCKSCENAVEAARKAADPRLCTIGACTRKLAARGMCGTHWMRWRQHGDALAGVLPWNPAVAYTTVHSRCGRLWGSASQYPCIDCGLPAAEWSYDHTDPTEMISTAEQSKGYSYSAFPEFYAPRCKSCHTKLDRYAQVAR